MVSLFWDNEDLLELGGGLVRDMFVISLLYEVLLKIIMRSALVLSE